MGFTPNQVREMSLWDFMACVEGHNKAHGSKSAGSAPEMTDDEYDALCELGEKWSAENGR